MMNFKELDELENEGADKLPSEERRKFLQFGLAVTGVYLGGSVLSLTSAGNVRAGSSRVKVVSNV